MKTNRFLIFIILCLLKHQAFSFNNEKDSLPKLKKNSFYTELLGAGILGSIDYERAFKVKKNTFLVSIGALYIPRKKVNSHPSKYLFVPIKISFEIGKKQHFYPSIGFLYEDGTEYYYSNPDGLRGIKYQKTAVLFFYCSPINYRFNFKNSTFLSVNLYAFRRIYYLNENMMGLKYDYRVYPFLGIQFGKKF
jgi:hypothetical protein